MRITPAHAGKSTNKTPGKDPLKDHPRPCGEKLIRADLAGAEVGSPPPMRGKEAVAWLKTQAGRITPAHAGKSSIPAR